MTRVTSAMLAIPLLAVLALVFGAGTASAVFFLDFEGLQDLEIVDEFYDGGTGGNGSGPGPDYGVEFGGNALALIDADAGGSGNFGWEPSPSTVMFWLTNQSTFMNVAAGFDTGFSLFYSTDALTGFIDVYDDLNGMGNLLGSFALDPTVNGGVGDPTGYYTGWAPKGVAFNGMAKSVVFGGPADLIGFDNITFGDDDPVPAVPEPAGMALLGMGLVAAGIYARLRRKTQG